MMKFIARYSLCFAILAFFLFSSLSSTQESDSPTWGFFAHKRINRLAVLTLPPEMMVFFKPNIDYVTDHAVDPDMRRYASKHEAPKHYIDLDMYNESGKLPALWSEAVATYTNIYGINKQNDTLVLCGLEAPDTTMRFRTMNNLNAKKYRGFIINTVLRAFNNDETALAKDSVVLLYQQVGWDTKALTEIQSVFYKEHITEHGILPWNLQSAQRKLTDAFRNGDGRRILQLAAEMGHYIGDAHVPLHTSSNYNGQKTGQHGIHGFWESRIPELFADESYDYFVGKAEYIANTTQWFWETVYASNTMVDSVLLFERELRTTIPSDRQMCPDMRLGIMVVTPCRDFAAAYQESMNGMVERRMREAIHAVSNAWFTAWTDAGQPDMQKITIAGPSEEEKKEAVELRKKFEQGKIMGRSEDH